MKVSISKRTKDCIYASQLDAAKIVSMSCKDDAFSAMQYAEIAASLLLDDNSVKIFRAEAYVMPNNRIYDQFGSPNDETGNLDVWIDFSAKSWNTFIEGGAYLTDIWGLCSDNREETKRHMFCVRYDKR